MADHERIGRFIYGCHRRVSPDELRVLPGCGDVAPALAERGAVLADWQSGTLENGGRLERPIRSATSLVPRCWRTPARLPRSWPTPATGKR